MTDVVINLAEVRERRAAAQMSEAMAEIEPGLPHHLATVQQGSEIAAQLMGVDPPLVMGEDDSYYFGQLLARDVRVLAGKKGMDDFDKGFIRVSTDPVLEPQAPRYAAFTYGAYATARLLLPQRYQQTAIGLRTCDRLVGVYQARKEHQDATEQEAIDAVLGRAAATLSFIALSSQGVKVKFGHGLYAAAQNEVLLTKNAQASEDFKQRLDDEDAWRLAGHNR